LKIINIKIINSVSSISRIRLKIKNIFYYIIFKDYKNLILDFTLRVMNDYSKEIIIIKKY
jgi:hypothetical protein